MVKLKLVNKIKVMFLFLLANMSSEVSSFLSGIVFWCDLFAMKKKEEGSSRRLNGRIK